MNKSILFVFTILLMVSDLIQFTYEVGKASAPYIKMTVAFVITAAIYTYENWYQVDAFRHRVSRAFSYENDTPVLV